VKGALARNASVFHGHRTQNDFKCCPNLCSFADKLDGAQ
jgi:hypothetical protein